MATLTFYSGTMDSGKSTLALQTHHTHSTRGRVGLVYTKMDRGGQPAISSRLGISTLAREVDDATDLYQEVSAEFGAGRRVDYVIADEVQFYTPEQVEQLARVADLLHVDVYAFGIATDFRTRLFPGAARMVELADAVVPSPVPALCWCGSRGTHQARLVDGTMVMDGDLVVVGDTDRAARVSYEVLCRRHHMQSMTAPREHPAPE